MEAARADRFLFRQALVLRATLSPDFHRQRTGPRGKTQPATRAVAFFALYIAQRTKPGRTGSVKPVGSVRHRMGPLAEAGSLHAGAAHTTSTGHFGSAARNACP